MKNKFLPSKSIKRGILLLFAFVCIALLVVIKLFKLQILGYENFQNSVIDQLTVETNVNPSRGIIYDTNGNVLATNKTVWILYICPKNIKDSKFIASKLSQIIDVSEPTIIEKAKKRGYKYQILHNSLSKEQADKIRELIEEYKLNDQIKLKASAKRYYPYSDLASHTLGFVNSDGMGIYGLEKVYNNILEGTNGKYITAQNAQSGDMPFQYEKYIEDENGYNLVTTIDMYIQRQLEGVLKTASIESGAKNRATGIVMNPKTGEVYAMATYPSFDLNEPYTLDDISQSILDKSYKKNTTEYKKEYLNLLFSMWNNKAVTELYEPGSTFKIVTTSVALQEGVASNLTRFNCSGSLKIDGYYRPISCHKRTGHGNIDFAQALQQSCNPAMMTLGMRIGREKFYEYFKKFGYSERTGIDLPSESSGYYHPFDDFSGVSLAVYSFGQTFKTTAIQQLSAISTVANGGYRVTPHFLKQIVDDNGSVIYDYESKKGEQIIKTDICANISRILKEGVDGEGGAKNAYVGGYSVCAKTGTSEKKDKYDANGNTSYRVSSCVAYAPSEDAQISVIMIVDEPSIGTAYGSVVVAPYISQFLELILPYMGNEPKYSETDIEHKQVMVGDYTEKSVEEAVEILKESKINYEIIGNGDTVISQLPIKNSKIYQKSGKIMLYTTQKSEDIKQTEVPLVIGKTPEEANKILVNSGLNIKIDGATNAWNGGGAKVVYQSHPAGTILTRGEVITIKIMYVDEKE